VLPVRPQPGDHCTAVGRTSCPSSCHIPHVHRLRARCVQQVLSSLFGEPPLQGLRLPADGPRERRKSMKRYYRPYKRYGSYKYKRRRKFEHTNSGKAMAFGGKVIWNGARYSYKAARTGYRVGKKAYRGAKFMYRLAKGAYGLFRRR
jgi:hypothetical protein